MRRILCVLLLLLPGISWATAYKCLEDGRVVYSTEPCPGSAQILVSSDGQADLQGKLALHMNANHIYSSPGTINDTPVTFLIDPNLSNSAISQRVAESAGIHSCSGKNTAPIANWVVRNCVVTVHEITFGDFNFKDLKVTVLPNMIADGSLGIDVLRRMKVHMGDGVMYLSNR